MIFALCDWFDFVCNQTDVNIALLYADLKEVIHIKPPTGVNVPHRYVLRLRKAFYGLEHAPRTWYQFMTSVLLHLGFSCVYLIRVFIFKMIIVRVYVDDVLTAGKS